MKIDIEKLRQYLINYYGTAMTDLLEVENASNEKVLSLALKNNINLNNFTK